MRKILLACLFACFAAQDAAAEGDLKSGTFNGRFCGVPARFEVTWRNNGTWLFDGRILIRDTGEYDRLLIEQYNDNSLKIVRYLGGHNTGKRQWAFTGPPAMKLVNGIRYLHFTASRGNGVACKNAGASTEMWVPD